LSEKQTTWVSWGSGASGVLGQGHFEDVHVPEFTTLTEYPADVAVGGNHIVAVESTGISLYTWGKNECGQLGNGTTSPAPTCVPVCIGELKPGDHVRIMECRPLSKTVKFCVIEKGDVQ
jgi:alpha-tubulin suppressor-like RCC1 family protein